MSILTFQVRAISLGSGDILTGEPMTKLFDAFKLGELTLSNRIVMAPMTRSRASADGILGDMTATYYTQRAGAGLIITEATAVSKQGSGYPNIPGIWSDAQTKAWAAIPKAVHAKGGKIFMQIFHTGRIGHSSLYGGQPVSSSAAKADGEVMAADYSMQPYETPRALGESEIPLIVEQFRTGAAHAKSAGFDGIEIHAANAGGGPISEFSLSFNLTKPQAEANSPPAKN